MVTLKYKLLQFALARRIFLNGKFLKFFYSQIILILNSPQNQIVVQMLKKEIKKVEHIFFSIKNFRNSIIGLIKMSKKATERSHFHDAVM